MTDLLDELFGYDKFSEITSDHMIRSTYCDLAVKLNGELALLVEVKANGLALKDQHIKRAVDYAANQGTDWVALTNGVHRQVYRVSFTKPIQHEVVVDLDLLSLNPRKRHDRLSPAQRLHLRRRQHRHRSGASGRRVRRRGCPYCGKRLRSSSTLHPDARSTSRTARSAVDRCHCACRPRTSRQETEQGRKGVGKMPGNPGLQFQRGLSDGIVIWKNVRRRNLAVRRRCRCIRVQCRRPTWKSRLNGVTPRDRRGAGGGRAATARRGTLSPWCRYRVSSGG